MKTHSQPWQKKLSVCILSYNHEKFIAQAVAGALNQVVDFDYEIVIGDDHSTDRSPEILLELQRAHPDRIRLLLRPTNIGMNYNFADVLRACQGEYIAFLDGDDYWTEPHKLQKQVAFLDAHPECVICFHNVITIGDDGRELSRIMVPANQKEISTLADLLKSNFIPSCSVVFRNGLVPSIPEWFYQLSQGDYPLHVLNAEHGDIGYLNEVMAAYRVHDKGLWTSLDELTRLQAELRAFETLDRHFNSRYRRIVGPIISRYYLEMAVEHENRGALSEARSCARRSWLAPVRGLLPPSKDSSLTLLRLYLPRLHRSLTSLKKLVSRPVG